MRDTSAAALSSIEPSAQQMRLRVLAEITRYEYGLTCDEVEANLDMRHQTASARVNELMKAGQILDSEIRRKTRSGADAIVWISAGLSSPLKWAGGKSWAVPRLRRIYAPHRHRRLVEPFVGGMNVALGLLPERALLGDVNPHLVNFFSRLRDPRPFTLEMRNSEHLYYAYRDCFNELMKMDGGAGRWTPTAAELFYYLNRSCFNGLCRFNSSGLFNTPFGKYATINYRRDFSEYALHLRRWEIVCASFDALAVADDDFVFLDPPYDGTFTDYAAGGFSWDEQVRLAERFAQHRGPVVATNQATERIVQLYSDCGYRVETAPVRRSISSSGDRAPAIEIFATKNLDN